ncbi:chaperone DnaJ-domain superfamily protein [Striga asiatica]|uniref:Chaperone DnaJ-domain superfamily protein n=1 Tax=Striga asiatica TaxID=4170 RepID=A0A5A7QFR6_STRAF|nr:chaperone DnaJ-domain superfamily protein [Striga asiatica]
MNKASRLAAKIGFGANHLHTRARFFHCTPVLERRRRTHWDSTSSFRSSPRKFNQYSKRLRRQSLLRNASEFAEHLFQSWQLDTDEFDQPFGRDSSWSRPHFTENGSKKGKSRYRTSHTSRYFEFYDDDDDDDEVEFETIFRSAFGGTRGFYWSFTIDDEPHYRNSSTYSRNYRNSSSRRRKYEYEEEEENDSSSDYEIPLVDMTSDRLALGLASSGPLNIEDVKNAYRACALKWHPDRHHGSSKVSILLLYCDLEQIWGMVVAEEKFKACSSAYQSLCDKLGLDVPNYPTHDEKTEYFSKKSYSWRWFEKAFPDERLALGLPAAGPLNLEDVKTAYRSCALKWHPDHHHSSSKAFAEEKFKNCNKAYQSLCHQLSSS